nr:DUF6252 family protein [uncultured Emticicia sp.]
MKKVSLIFMVLLSQFFISCSSDNSSSSNPSSTNVGFSMKVNGVDCTLCTPINNGTIFWKKFTNNDGSHSYSLVALFSRNGDNNLNNQVKFVFKTENLLPNQIFPVSPLYTPTDPITWITIVDGGAGRLYNANTNSTGQIKITQFDGVTMSGTFSFSHLNEYTNYSTLPFIDITDGVFTNVPVAN